MTWNYRVMRRQYPEAAECENIAFAIYEVYYDDNGEPELHTVDEMAPSGETLLELVRDLEHMLEAVGKPVLDYETRKPITGD